MNKIITTSLILLLFLFTSCGLYKKTDARKVSPNVEKRVEKNLESGKGISFRAFGNGSGTFDFASSNEMWRASIETLDFVSLTNASYSGGIIITDWFKGNSSENRELKITIQFLANEIRADALSIAVHEKICDAINSQNCTITKVNSTISGDLKLAILKKAALIKNDSLKKKKKKKKKS
jgi:hypothetical protein|tara:strand:- start:356 stop:892 length:537 start_codon:yes stop_codon:yes gene_type:complete